MATLEQLNARKRELEDKLADGDLSVEAALDRIDNAIAARTREIQYSRKRVAAVKEAVAKGVKKEDTSPRAVAASVKKRAGKGKPINRF